MHMHPHSESGTDHNHEHPHAHTHEHTHDGVTHTHEHSHIHSHEHEHPHHHEHLHEDAETHDHAHTPMAELLILMKYMTGHNAAHTEELAELAHKLDDAGNHAAYQKVMDAVASFQNGNTILAEVLKELSK